MKKTILFLMFILMSFSVFAQGQGIHTEVSMEKTIEIREELMNKINNTQAPEALYQSVERFRERVQNRSYEKYEVKNMTQNNITMEVGRKGRLFGLIPATVNEEVVIDNEGNELKRKESWWIRFMSFE